MGDPPTLPTWSLWLLLFHSSIDWKWTIERMFYYLMSQNLKLTWTCYNLFLLNNYTCMCKLLPAQFSATKITQIRFWACYRHCNFFMQTITTTTTIDKEKMDAARSHILFFQKQTSLNSKHTIHTSYLFYQYCNKHFWAIRQVGTRCSALSDVVLTNSVKTYSE